ncbi:hypothetical protein MMC25_005963 [Agyrium rufum]|nr:hypothetical protein [Agyrium rufum]
MGNTTGKPVVFTEEVNLNHFRLLRVVGKGAFGKVRIVERKDTGLTFALKYIRKDEIVRSESVRNIIRERRMLEHLNHPFLCNLRYSFQDIEYLYIVQDLMNGGDLRFHISRKTFTEEAVRFWMAELACALRYIHKQGIVHRDLKPDNILLDSEGHVHLADFNVASDFKPNKPLHSKSGTLAYLAPEVYAGTGYLDEVDWWSLGVTFYECIYNKRPFEAHNHEKLEKEILRASPNYPVTQPPVSMPCLGAIRSLLERNVQRRIGALDFSTYANHEFFEPIDFVALELKKIPPIFIPSSEKTNFDATYDLEELLLEEAPLEARARRQKPRAQLKDDATEKEIRDEQLHRMIETLFEPFDYTGGNFESLLSTTTPLSTGSDPANEHSQGSPTKLSNDDTHLGSPHVENNVVNSPASDIKVTPGGPETPHSEYFSAPDRPRSTPPTTPAKHPKDQQRSAPHMPHMPHNQRERGNTRSTSKGGGVQVVLGETGSWGDLQDKSATLPAEGVRGAGGKGAKPTGMLGFLSRKGGRARSPKPREAGVLGKEGARVVINNGR